jgi:transcriptional regulator with XRE-family HTH domain
MSARFLRALGAKITTVREVKNISRAVLANRVGRSSGHIGRIEEGAIDCPITLVRKIASALRVPLQLLLPTASR